MFGLFKSDPDKKVKRQIEKLYAEAVSLQRNGKLKEYAEIIAKVEDLKKKLSDS